MINDSILPEKRVDHLPAQSFCGSPSGRRPFLSFGEVILIPDINEHLMVTAHCPLDVISFRSDSVRGCENKGPNLGLTVNKPPDSPSNLCLPVGCH